MANPSTLIHIILFSLCTLSLQAQQLHTVFEVLHPAEIALPDAIDHVVLVNNALVQSADFGHQNKVNDVKTKMSVDLSSATRYCLFGALQGLTEHEFVSSVAMVPESMNHSSSFYRRTPLTQSAIDSLLRINDADALLVLNQLIIYDMQEVYLTDEELYYANLQAYASAHWSVHYRGRTSLVQMVVADTLLWQSWEPTIDAAWELMPNRQDALLALASYAGERLAQRIQPSWRPVDRYFYESKDALIVAGNEALAHRRWQQAIDLWQQAYSEAGKKQHITRAYAAANIAVLKEIDGDFSAAIYYTDLAIDAFRCIKSADALQQQVNLQYYKKQLQARQTGK